MCNSRPTQSFVDWGLGSKSKDFYDVIAPVVAKLRLNAQMSWGYNINHGEYSQ